jgi:hypothetical protein
MLLKIITFICVFLYTFSNLTSACTIAVISGKITNDGRPLLFKTRYERDEYREEVKYYKPVGDEKYGHMSVVKWGFNRGSNFYPDVINGAGINDAGLIISNTTVSDINPLSEATNSNMYLLNYSITHCKNLKEFEELLANWNNIRKFSTVNGNFAVVDGEGGAAMYEVYAPIQGAKVEWEKYDANSAVDNNGDFIGFVVRTNDNQWSPYTGGAAREKRANEILNELLKKRDINYKSLMRNLARDVCGDVEKTDIGALKKDGTGIDAKTKTLDIHNFYTETCISRYSTRFAFIGKGINKGDDKRLITMWVNLGEPDVGIFTPYFPATKKVPLYAWADPVSTQSMIVDNNSSSVMNDLISHKGKLYVYDNLVLKLDPLGLLITESIDKTVDYAKILEIQNWVFPTEDTIVVKTEEFLNFLRENSKKIDQDLLYNFSDYALNFAYDDYKMLDNESSIHYNEWNFIYN